MKKIINNKVYDLAQELVEYIEELEYYHSYTLGKRVVDIHFGIIGTIQFMFKTYESIPDAILPDKDAFYQSLGKIVTPNHKNVEWFLVKSESRDEIHLFPYAFWKIMPPKDSISKEDSEDSDEYENGGSISDE
jgi:hypothetical protein